MQTPGGAGRIRLAPGLTRSTHGPKFENASRVPSATAEPTVRTRSRLPGIAASLLPSLPAETIVIVPLRERRGDRLLEHRRRRWRSTSAAGLLLERLMTGAPALTAASMPLTTQSTVVSDERL